MTVTSHVLGFTSTIGCRDHLKRKLKLSPVQVAAEQKKGLLSRPADLLLTLLLLAAASFSVFRGFVSKTEGGKVSLAASSSTLTPVLTQVVMDSPLESCFSYVYHYEPYLKDPVAFPRVMVSLEKRGPRPPQTPPPLPQRPKPEPLCHRSQMLVYFFYALPLLAAFLYGLTTPGCSWMLDWTIFFAGAAAQVSGELLIFSQHARYNIDTPPPAALSDPVVPHRGVSSLPNPVHVPGPIR